MMEATHLKDMTGWNGEAKLYRVNPPINDHEYVVVSKASVPITGWETYIFPADENGKVEDFLELPGSVRGFATHETVLSEMGYQVS